MNIQQQECPFCCECRVGIFNQYCGCFFCAECFWTYVEQKLMSCSFMMDDAISCPMQCGRSLLTSDLCCMAQSNKFPKLDEMLLKKYSTQTKDIRVCPSQNCNFFGILPQKECCQMLQCSQCETEWNCPELQPITNIIKRSLRDSQIIKNELQTAIHEYMFTKHCPKCGVAIFKNGGCYHMTCGSCNFEFCWYCRQEYKSHQMEACMLQFVILYGLIVNMFFNFMTLWGYHLIVARAVLWIASIIYDFCLYNGILLVVFRFLRTSVAIEVSLCDEKRNKMVNAFLMETLKLVMALYIMNYCSITSCSWVRYMSYEVLAMAVGGAAFIWGRNLIESVTVRWLDYVC